MATRTAAAANAASSNAVALKEPLGLLNAELAKLSAPTMLALIEEGRELTARLEQATVADEDDYAATLLNCKAAKGIEEQLDEAFEPFVAAANTVHKGFIKWRDIGAGANALENARKAAARKAGQWQQAEEARQRQKLLEEQQERERQAEVARLLELEELEASGQVEAAEELAREPVIAEPPSPPQPVVERVQGTAYVEQWKYQITTSVSQQLAEIIERLTDPRVKLAEVIEHLERLIPFVTFDEKRVAATVRSLKQDTRIPGVSVWDEGNLRVGAV